MACTEIPLPEGASDDLKAQAVYAEKMDGDEIELMVADAFVRGIRDIGYKSTGTALNELVDNAIQAGAGNVHVLAVCEQQTTGKKGPRPSTPKYLAVIDDGHGMPPKMLRHAIRWGGTHRENDRTGFGRFGYGLPSSCVSQGRRFIVYSSVGGGEWYAAGLDIDLVSDGTYNRGGRIVIPSESRKSLPAEVLAYIEKQVKDGKIRKDALDRGTVVVIDKLDPERVEEKTQDGLDGHLMENFGITYRNYLRDCPMYVNGKRVESIDPLFITPGAWLYDFDLAEGKRVVGPTGVKYEEMRAEIRVEERNEATGEVIAETGTLTIRLARLPAGFAVHKSKKSKRWKIMNDYNGVVVSRLGRQIDVVRTVPREWEFKFGNDARYVRCEIDFPPVLDRYFSVTTSKQQIVIKAKLLIDILSEQLDLGSVLRKIRADYVAQRLADQEKEEVLATTEPGTLRPSELVMVETVQFDPRPAPEPTPEQIEEDEQVWQEEVKAEVIKTGRPVAQVEADLKARVLSRPWEIKLEAKDAGPFYRPVRMGGAVWLYLNTDHRFYKEVYRGPESTPRLRASLELLLFVMGTAETRATEAALAQVYKWERGCWSITLDAGLSLLQEHLPVADVRDELIAEEEVDAGAVLR